MRKTVEPALRLSGTITPPADKSIAQRAALFALLSSGTSRITNYPVAEDPRTALSCIRQLGAQVDADGETVTVTGTGRDGMAAPAGPVDCGNSGTVMRLLAGILAGSGVSATLKGDDSLSRRPMKRIMDPLTRMGAEIHSAGGGLPPLIIRRDGSLQPIRFRLPVASAQLKSCVLLAGLFGDEATQVVEPVSTRNHTETMLGLPVVRENGMNVISSSRRQVIPPQDLQIPGDFSAAAFWLVAGSIIPDSEIIMPATGVNPTRNAAMHILRRMGADIVDEPEGRSGNEPVARLTVRSATLKPTRIRPEEIPNAIDELPVLCVAMAFADGVSRITGAEELRYKESDRLDAIQQVLEAAGVRIEGHRDGLTIHGEPGRRVRAASHDSRHDHRIAMAAAILSLMGDDASHIENAEAASVSYPEFWTHLDNLAHR
jgi:3-phosphoshikimate 1-carboxyvinyltransferase